MKYKINNMGSVGFKPIKVSLVLETKEEYVHFHDKVLPALMKVRSHPFIGSIYRAGQGKGVRDSGDIKQ